MKTNNVLFVIFVLIIIPFTILSSDSPFMSNPTVVPANTAQDKMGESKVIALNPKNIPQIHINQLKSYKSLCSCSEDNLRPLISELDDFRYYMGMSKPIPIINWSVEDQCPETYMIYVNSEQVDSGSWENGTISWSLSGIAGFNIGVYNITIVIQDMNGNRASDTVIVEVWDVITTSEFLEFRWTNLLVFVCLILFYMRENRGRVQ